MIIEPTVGRVVLFHPSESLVNSSGMAVSSPQPLAATVAYVHSTRCVNLAIFDHNGYHYNITSVRLLQDDDKPNDGESYAEWMPYQIEQAKKHAGVSAPEAATA
jgi:hypothetical protein